MNKDTICREDAIDEMERIMADHPLQGYEDELLLINAIKSLPSADRPRGEWKHLKGDEWLCSECGHVIWTEGSWEHPLKRGRFYCENCGAQMRGEQDE